MKIVALVVVALMAVATFAAPQPDQPVPRVPDPRAPAPYAVCPLGEAAQRSTALTFVGGPSAGEPSVSVFSGGEIVVDSSVALSNQGGGFLDLTEVTGVARAPVLVPLGEPAPAVESVIVGEGTAASSCGAGSPDAQVLLGGATAEGDTYTLSIANPFAGSALVDILAASEVGTESDPALAGVVVPPRSLIAVDLHTLLPGRQAISTAIVTNQGRVVAGAVHASGGDISATSPLTAGLDWYLPLPAVEGMSRWVVLYAPGTAEVPFQVDVYSDEGLVEAAYDGVVPPQGQLVIPASDLLEGAGAIRILSAAPLAAGLHLAGEAGNAVLPASATPSPSWKLSGAGRGGEATVHLFNPGVVDVSAELQAGGGEPLETVAVPAGTLVDVPLPARPVGARLEADGDLIVSWTTAAENGLSGDAGQPSTG